jgi:hypothetical protein
MNHLLAVALTFYTLIAAAFKRAVFLAVVRPKFLANIFLIINSYLHDRPPQEVRDGSLSESLFYPIFKPLHYQHRGPNAPS